MTSFAKDVTTPVNIPAVQPVTQSPGQAPLSRAADLLTFGLQFQQRKQARSAEEARQATLNKGLGIAQGLEDLQGQVSDEQFFIEAQKRVRNSGGSLTEQAQIGAVVANQFGAPTLGEAIMSESEKFANDLNSEFRGLGEFGDIALMEKFPSTTASELDNDSMEVVIERGRKIQADAVKNASDKKQAEEALRQGNLGLLGDWFKADKEQHNALGGTMMSLYTQRVSLAAEQGVELVGEPLMQMKESLIAVTQNQKKNLQEQFSGDVLLQIQDPKEQSSVRSLRDDRIKFYDDQITFLNEFEADEFKNFADAAALLKDKDNLDLMRSSPEFLRLKNMMGTQAFGALISERMAKDPAFRNQLKAVQMKAFSTIGFDQNDQFAAGVSIMAGIGEGKSLDDYDAEDKTQASNVYWSTAKGFIDTPGVIDNSDQAGITSMAIASVQVLEFAEERGTIEDKQRALQTINSPQFRKLYEKSPPDIKEAMGRKVIQYNRDTFEDNAQRLIKDLGGTGIGSTISYDANKGQFSVEFNVKLTEEQARAGGASGVLFSQKQQRAKVDALNKQLDVVKIYAKDDPFLSSLSEKEQRDFLVRSAGLPGDVVKGQLSAFSPQHEEASRKGVTVEELKQRTDLVTETEREAGVFAEIERQVAQSNLSPEVVQGAIQSAQKFLSGDNNDADILAVMRENPTLTFAEAEKLAKSQGKK